VDVVGREVLEQFKRKHPDVQSQVDSWLLEVEEAVWKTLQDITKRYQSASILSENRVVFYFLGG
jgi:mRNA interferase HigB